MTRQNLEQRSCYAVLWILLYIPYRQTKTDRRRRQQQTQHCSIIATVIRVGQNVLNAIWMRPLFQQRNQRAHTTRLWPSYDRLT